VTRHVAFRSWSPGSFKGGAHDGTSAEGGGLRIATPSRTREYDDPHRPAERAGRFEEAAWTSPEVTPGFGATEVIASWNASTPPGTWLEVAVCARLADGTDTGWRVLGRWAETDSDIAPTSVGDQDDAVAAVAVDTLRLSPERPALSYRVRVTLLRRPRTPATPVVRLLAATASALPPDLPAAVPGAFPGTVIDVPSYSQQVHRGEYPEFDSGGQSWCSPTSVSMVLGHWGRGPAPADYAWVDEGLKDRFVDHAARHCFDHLYRGAGNWAFNTAYAARFGMRAFVTRLRGLDEAELFVAAGIPLVLSVAFAEDELDGAGYDTQGHLLVLVGIDEHGDVVCNDPASHGEASNDKVRTTYDRAQLERAWIRASGGVTYVIHPPDVALPAPRVPEEPNW
jgi:hypothetical protein